MSEKQQWKNISGKTIFMAVSGQVQRVRPDQTVTGSIAEDLKCDFKLVESEVKVDPDAEEKAAIRARLEELKEPKPHHAKGIVGLRELLEAAEEKAAAGSGDEEPDTGDADDEEDPE